MHDLSAAPPWCIRPATATGVGAAVAVAAAVLIRGRTHPDEILQFLEPAHFVAFGTWLPTWEWRVGLRNWAAPGLLGGVLKVALLAGARDPWALATAVWVACAALQAVGAVGLYRLVAERDGRSAAAVAAWVHATWGGWLIYSARPLSETLGVVPLLWALVFAARSLRVGRGGDGALTGLLLGASFVLRYPNAVFGVPVLLALALARRWRSLAGAAGAGLLVVAGLAVLDWATWGRPLHSMLQYLEFNLLSGEAARLFGVRPWWWYLPIWAGMAPLALAWHFAKGLARRDLLVAVFATYVAVFSAVPHKEARFLVPLLPLWAAIAAAPLAADLSRALSRPRLAGFLAVLWLALSVAAAAVHRPFSFNRQMVDMTVAAGRAPGLQALLLLGLRASSTGGRFYLGREDVHVHLSWGEPEELSRALLAGSTYTHALVGPRWHDLEALEAAGFTRGPSFGEFSLWARERP